MPRYCEDLRIRNKPFQRPLATLASVEMGDDLRLVLSTEPAFHVIAKAVVAKAIRGHGLLRLALID